MSALALSRISSLGSSQFTGIVDLTPAGDDGISRYLNVSTGTHIQWGGSLSLDIQQSSEGGVNFSYNNNSLPNDMSGKLTAEGKEGIINQITEIDEILNSIDELGISGERKELTILRLQDKSSELQNLLKLSDPTWTPPKFAN